MGKFWQHCRDDISFCSCAWHSYLILHLVIHILNIDLDVFATVRLKRESKQGEATDEQKHWSHTILWLIRLWGFSWGKQLITFHFCYNKICHSTHSKCVLESWLMYLPIKNVTVDSHCDSPCIMVHHKTDYCYCIVL